MKAALITGLRLQWLVPACNGLRDRPPGEGLSLQRRQAVAMQLQVSPGCAVSKEPYLMAFGITALSASSSSAVRSPVLSTDFLYLAATDRTSCSSDEQPVRACSRVCTHRGAAMHPALITHSSDIVSTGQHCIRQMRYSQSLALGSCHQAPLEGARDSASMIGAVT